MTGADRFRRAAIWWIAPAVLLLLNIWIAVRLFRLEYSANLGSNEGQFIALARGVALHLGDLQWWPEWSCGLPFQNTYMPLVPVSAGLWSRVSGVSPALAFHQVSAAFYCLGPVFLYFMALAIFRRPWPGFIAAAGYSVFSPCALLPAFRADLGSIWHLRRLQILGFYGEGAYTACLTMLPLAVLFLYLALARGKLIYKILAGVFMAATLLANAFGAVILAAAAAALIASGLSGRSAWKQWLTVAGIVALAYCWIAPALPPSVIAAIRMNSPSVDGDYRFTIRSLAGLALLAAGFALLWLATRKAPPHFRFSLLFAWLMAGIVVLGVVAKIYVLPQPHRYQIAMDMALWLAVVSGIAAGVEQALWPATGTPLSPQPGGEGAAVAGLRARSTRPSPRTVLATLLFLALAVQGRHAIRYARGLIRSTDITKTANYRLAQWIDSNLHGRRVMIGGSYSFYADDFADIPQLHGGQDPMLPNFMLRIATFTIYSGMNAGARDGEISALWLKALGAHAVAVPGPGSQEIYKPFANPRKFDGILPVLWQSGGDTVYGVPARSYSLAHAMNAADLVHDPPVNGLDTAQLERYVAALDSPAYPPVTWRWTSRHSAIVEQAPWPATAASAPPGRGDNAISVQITYSPGWRATAGGSPVQISRDGLGFLALKPACDGPCRITLTFDGGPEWRVACGASLAVMLLVAFLAVRSLLRKPRDLDRDGRKLGA